MFLYIKDYFQKRIFHIFLIIFCGLLMFNSIMTLIDLKNYEVVIDYSDNQKYCQTSNLGETKLITFERPVVKVKYKYANMPFKFTWVTGQLLEKNISIKNYTIEYWVYKDFLRRELIDSFTQTYKFPYSNLSIIQKEYDTVSDIILDVVDYEIKFNTRVYLPHIFIIAGCLFFIFPSAVMLYKIKKEQG